MGAGWSCCTLRRRIGWHQALMSVVWEGVMLVGDDPPALILPEPERET
jgi:hypothetical protein